MQIHGLSFDLGFKMMILLSSPMMILDKKILSLVMFKKLCTGPYCISWAPRDLFGTNLCIV